MKIGYFTPSYRRPKDVTTQEIFPYVRYVVAEEEKENYEKEGHKIIVCPNEIQGNISRVRNWILDTFLPVYDVVVIMDDDYYGVYRWEKQKGYKLNADEFEEHVEHLAILGFDMGVYLLGVNVNSDKGAYREYTPFSTVSYIGAPLQIHLKGAEPRYDERLPLKEDYDITLQHLKKYGKVLRANFLFYRVKQAEQTGGVALYRNTLKEKEQFELLQKKWGKKIIQRDKQSKRGFDFNPILKSPIKGV